MTSRGFGSGRGGKKIAAESAGRCVFVVGEERKSRRQNDRKEVFQGSFKVEIKEEG